MKQFEQVIKVMELNGGYATLGFLNQNVDVSNIQNSILKFFDLQDFYSHFYIVSDIVRKKEFDVKMKFGAFKEIKDRIQFIDYNFVSNLHTKSFELLAIGDF